MLGDGSRGGYAGVAPQAELIFQAMENDNNGQFLSPSLNYILNQAYSQGARIHTNSWGSSQASDQGKYTSSAEDIDDRTAAYDRTHANQEGLLVLFAAGNDGPGTGTVGALDRQEHPHRGEPSEPLQRCSGHDDVRFIPWPDR